eukprot:GHVS01096176.1.p1 GENE.GHVS01096176.1~~GHVS01096176.1.p1  ORF type:complete len:392 (+),score=62.54 GHVS01096176.1:65-1240(+)
MSGYKFSSANVVYIKNLSPLVTEVDIRQTLNDQDEILNVEFKQFPNSAQRFCQIDFRSSGGVTAATSLNSQPLLGLPMAISVIDPLGPNSSFAPSLPYDPSSVMMSADCSSGANSIGATMPPASVLAGFGGSIDATMFSGRGGGGSMDAATAAAAVHSQSSILNIALQSHIANTQAVQLASLQARQLAEQRKHQLAAAAAAGFTGAAAEAVVFATPSPALPIMNGMDAHQFLAGLGLSQEETEEKVLSKTVHVANIPLTYNDQDVQKLFSKFGSIKQLRCDISPEKLIFDDSVTRKFAIVEFTSAEQASESVRIGSLHAAGRTLVITMSKVTVVPCDPEGVRYDVGTVPTVPVAYQQVHKMKLEEKMMRVRSFEASIAKKLHKRARDASVC